MQTNKLNGGFRPPRALGAIGLLQARQEAYPFLFYRTFGFTRMRMTLTARSPMGASKRGVKAYAHSDLAGQYSILRPASLKYDGGHAIFPRSGPRGIRSGLVEVSNKPLGAKLSTA
jgi:hypothetical protein